MLTYLFFYGAALAVVHSLVQFGIGFKIHSMLLCLLCIPRMYKYYMQRKEAAKMASQTLCWDNISWDYMLAIQLDFLQEIIALVY
ncbi:hypothetical protein BHE74_00032812 [Ensete ventricosum]|nr:hypothetical protein GW17_00015412 [Ensete ventricosum]RWW60208.1 hypothetical protein BHE74_00032812 [Ensete ventricosum]RZR96268.1 hypothetical protein BHM03_00025264 [Ensete ventricosum]